jgi:hypothetical protein
MPPARLAGNDRTAARSTRRVLESCMPARLPSLAWILRATLIAASLPLLSDCGPGRNEFAPVCPRSAFLGGAADLDRYRNPDSTTHDLTDLILHARMVGISGQCRAGSNKNQVISTVTVGIEFTRGPAMAGRETDLLYFIAVVDGATIVDKRVYTTHITFPANVDRYSWASDEANLVLPVTAAKSAAAYTVLVGFQFQGQ